MALTAKKVYAILKRQISDMEAKIKTPIIYRGTVATADLLPLNPDIGDMYNIESKSVYGEAGMNVAWNGVVWDTMGAPIDMSLYIKSSELADWVKQQNKPTYTAEEVGALPADTKIPSKTSDLQNDSGFLTEIPDNYLSGTDKTLNVSGKAADAKATGDKITELSSDISNKLNKNQGSENSGKIAGINESGDIVPMFPVSVDYNEETNCLEFGSDQKMELNKGINLDSTLTKTGYAADAGVVGELTTSLKSDISTKITKFYASNQGETHITDSDNGKIQDMMIYGKSSQNGTPTPENPVEIKSVVNPKVVVYGKNIAKKVTVVDELQQYITSLYIVTDLRPSTTYVLSFECASGYSGYINEKLFEQITFQGTGNRQRVVCKTKSALQSSELYEKGWRIVKNSPGNTIVPKFTNVMLERISASIAYESYHEQTITLPYTLNAIPVESGGNVTIDGQQYIADYVDVERGKLVRMCKEYVITGSERLAMYWLGNASYLRNVCCINNFENIVLYDGINPLAMSDMFIGKISENADDERAIYLMLRGSGDKTLAIKFLDSDGITTVDLAKQWLIEHKPKIVFVLSTPEEIDLTAEEIAAFKALATYYPTTNISVNSEQLDGYTVFNYPISMQNGWNYVKQQIGDTRDYIYDMDARTQDTDLQAAEAYVNSEYAVALTELEV